MEKKYKNKMINPILTNIGNMPSSMFIKNTGNEPQRHFNATQNQN